MDITVTVDGEERFDKWAGSSRLLDAELLTAMTRSTAQIQAQVMAGTPVWRGTARRSHTTEVTPRLSKVGTNLVHAVVQSETGRRAGAAMPPAGSLLAWMSSKGIDGDLEYVIRRAISRNGIIARRLYSIAFQQNQGAIQAEFQAAIRRYVAKMTA